MNKKPMKLIQVDDSSLTEVMRAAHSEQDILGFIRHRNNPTVDGNEPMEIIRTTVEQAISEGWLLERLQSEIAEAAPMCHQMTWMPA